MHGKLHRIDIDQQGFLEAQQDFQLYHIYQASDSLCTCVGEEGKIKPKGIQKKKQLDKSSCVEANLQCLFFAYFGQWFEAQMLGMEGLAVFEVHNIGQVKKNKSVILIDCKYILNFYIEYCQFLSITYICTTAICIIVLYMYIHKILHRNRRRTALNSIFCAFNVILGPVFQCMRMRCGNMSSVMLEGRSQNLVVLSNDFHADLLYSEINLFVEQMRLAIHSLNTP